ncbi:hypothetical protein F5B20DRAFT_596088 [Whalleya microplaca]|nr:hypothetical protein F5B20DRAFT_596088 [Whalleya microplaca]
MQLCYTTCGGEPVNTPAVTYERSLWDSLPYWNGQTNDSLITDSAITLAEPHETLELPQSPAPDPEKRKNAKRGGIRGWSLEIIALLLSTAASISLVVVLQKVNNHPLSDWTFKFSVNTIVSILSIIIRTSLVFAISSCISQGKWAWFRKRSGPLSRFATFDKASRGPLGCVSLIWGLKSRYWLSLGAWVTLALLAMDPVLQSVITYDGRLDTTGKSDSTIARATGLDIGDWTPENTIIDSVDPQHVLRYYHTYPDIGISTTSIFGFVNTSTTSPSQPPLISCRTGNCTWPMYSSFEHITRTQDFGMPDQNDLSTCNSMSFTINNNYTTYSIPYTPTHSPIIQNFNGLSNQSVCFLESRIGLSAVFRPNETYSFKDSKALLASFAVLELPPSYWNNEVAIEDATPQATECAFEYCGRVFTTEMRDGYVNESTVLTSTLVANDSFKPTAEYAQNAVDTIDNDFENYLAPFDLEAYQSFDIMAVIDRTDLQIELPEATNFPEDLQRVFNVTQKSIATTMIFLAKSSTLDSITYAISNSTNITATFEAAAHLISDRMREIDGQMAYGDSEQWVIHICVRWKYIVFPGVVLVAGYIFTIGAIVESYILGLETIKDDLLATLVCGLDTDTRASLREEKWRDGKCADKRAKLEDEADGLVLRSSN